MNILEIYKQECGFFVHFVRLATTLLKDEESARDDHILACNCQISTDLVIFSIP